MKKNINKRIIFSIILGIVISFVARERLLSLSKIIDINSDDALIIQLDSKKNPNSYGRSMIIPSIIIDDEELTLKDYDSDQWTWFDEYNYLSFNGDEGDLTIPFNGSPDRIMIKAYKMNGSGIANIYLGDRLVETIDLYSSNENWETTVLTVYQNTRSRAFRVIVFDCIFICLLIFALYDGILILLKKEKIKTSIKAGTFNKLKAFGLIMVLLSHSINGSGYILGSDAGFIGNALSLVLYGLMPMFFIISGYGFRKENVLQGAKKQLSFFLKPYLTLAFFVSIAAIIKALIFHGNLNSVLYYSLPFLIFSNSSFQPFGIETYSIGPAWFFATLCFAWIILNVIVNISKKPLQFLCIGACVLFTYVYYLSGIPGTIIPIITLTVPFLYTGFMIKKGKTLLKEDYRYELIAVILTVVASVVTINNGIVDYRGLGFGKSFLITLVLYLFAGFILVYFYLRIISGFDVKKNVFDRIGFRTMDLLYIHAFWYLIIPWTEIMSGLRFIVGLKLVLLFFIHGLLIAITYYLKTITWDKIWKKESKSS